MCLVGSLSNALFIVPLDLEGKGSGRRGEDVSLLLVDFSSLRQSLQHFMAVVNLGFKGIFRDFLKHYFTIFHDGL